MHTHMHVNPQGSLIRSCRGLSRFLTAPLCCAPQTVKQLLTPHYDAQTYELSLKNNLLQTPKLSLITDRRPCAYVHSQYHNKCQSTSHYNINQQYNYYNNNFLHLNIHTINYKLNILWILLCSLILTF